MNVGLIGLVECTVLKRRFGVTKEMRAYERGVYGEEKKKNCGRQVACAG